METDKIDPDRKVAQLIEEHPQTFKVFRKYGCPDMRDGFFSLMARIMSIRNAARIHRIPLENLLEDLEQTTAEGKTSAAVRQPNSETPNIGTGSDNKGIELPADFAEHAATLSGLDTPPATLRDWWEPIFNEFSANGHKVEFADLYRDHPTRHEVHLDDHIRYAGCAMDALMAAVMEPRDTVTVRSIDPVAQRPVIFKVGVNSTEVSPREALVCFGSSVAPEKAESIGSFTDRVMQEDKSQVDAAICRNTHAFRNRKTYKQWAAETESITAPLPPTKVVELVRGLTQKQ